MLPAFNTLPPPVAAIAAAALMCLVPVADALVWPPDGTDGDVLKAAPSQIAKGEYEGALITLTNYLNSKDADKPAALELRAGIYLVTGAYAKARRDIEALLKSKPDSVAGALLKAEHATIMGEYATAKTVLNDVIAKKVDNHRARMLLLRAGYESGDKTVAAAQIDYYFALYNRDGATTAEALTCVAEAVRHEDPQGGWRAYKEARKKDAEYLDAYLLAANHAYAKYNWTAAATEFGEVLKRNPKHPDALAGLAATFFAENNYDKAIALADQALEINPVHALAHELKSAVLFVEERWQESLDELQTVLKVRPSSPSTLAMLAAYHDAHGTRAEVDKVIAQIHAFNPRNTEVYATLARSAERRYHFTDAVAWARKAIETDKSDWEGYHLAGMSLLRLGEESEGYKLLDKGFRMNRFNRWAYNTLLVLDKDFKKKDFVYKETEHFYVKLDKKDEKVLWPYLEKVLEESWDKYTTKYKIQPKGPEQYNGKILLLILPSHQLFSARTVGLPGLAASGVCFGQVITMPSPRVVEKTPEKFNWKHVFDHEFVHVLTIQLTNYNIPRWFTEGISVLEEEDFSVDWDAAFLWALDNEKLHPLEKLNLGFTRPKFRMSVPVSYYQSALICQHLRDTYGAEAIEKMIKVYAESPDTTKALTEATGKTMEALNKEVNAFLRKYADSLRMSAAVPPERVTELEGKHDDGDLSAGEWLELARGYLIQKRYDEAHLAANQVLEKDAGMAAAHSCLGVAVLEGEKAPDLAAKHFNRALEVDAANFAGHYYLGKIALEADKKDDAIKHFESARKSRPRYCKGDDTPYAKLVKLYREAGDNEKAVQVLRDMTRIDPTQFAFLKQIGDIYMELNKPDEALTAYVESIYVNPFDEAVHMAAAFAARDAKNTAAAEREFRVASALKARNMPALLGLVRILIDSDRKDEARLILDRIYRFDPHNEAAHKLEGELK
jgi:tetratricopeptide (TPR) repeat protein